MCRCLAALAACVAAASAQDPPSDDLFRPAALCSALESVGVRTPPWRPLGAPGVTHRVLYACEYRSSDENSPLFRLPGIAAPSTLFIFRVEGTAPERADGLSLSVTIRDGEFRNEARKRLTDSIDAVFAAIGRTPPPALRESIANERPYRFHAPYGALWYSRVLRDRPREEVFWFQLRARER